MKILAFVVVASWAWMVPAFTQSNDCDTLEKCQAAIKACRANTTVRSKNIAWRNGPRTTHGERRTKQPSTLKRRSNVRRNETSLLIHRPR